MMTILAWVGVLTSSNPVSQGVIRRADPRFAVRPREFRNFDELCKRRNPIHPKSCACRKALCNHNDRKSPPRVQMRGGLAFRPRLMAQPRDCLTRAGGIGKCRMRLPVSWATPLAIAGATA